MRPEGPVLAISVVVGSPAWAQIGVGASPDSVPLSGGGLRQGKVHAAVHADEDLIF
jgi:hypothetical protein